MSKLTALIIMDDDERHHETLNGIWIELVLFSMSSRHVSWKTYKSWYKSCTYFHFYTYTMTLFLNFLDLTLFLNFSDFLLPTQTRYLNHAECLARRFQGEYENKDGRGSINIHMSKELTKN